MRALPLLAIAIVSGAAPAAAQLGASSRAVELDAPTRLRISPAVSFDTDVSPLAVPLRALRRRRASIDTTELDVAGYTGAVFAAGGLGVAVVTRFEIRPIVIGGDPPPSDWTGRDWALGISLGVAAVGLAVELIAFFARRELERRRAALERRIDELEHRVWRRSFRF